MSVNEATDPAIYTTRARLQLAPRIRPPVDRDTHDLGMEVASLKVAVGHLTEAQAAANKLSEQRHRELRRAIAAGSTRWPSPREAGALTTAILVAFGTWWTVVHGAAVPVDPPAVTIPKEP